jgi:tight adherence protein B
MNPDQIINIIIMAAVFGLVLSVWCICVLLWLGQTLVRTKLVQKRLGIVRKETEESHTLRLWGDRKRETSDGVSQAKATLSERLESLKTIAGWRSSAQAVILRVVGAAVLAFLITLLSGGGALLGFGIAAGIVGIFWWQVGRSIAKHGALLEMQLVDGLGICARALRAGLPLLGSFQLISEEIEAPVGPIFFRICHEQLLGKDMKDSIRAVAKTVPSPELKLFATAVSIQLQSGGNLAELMDSLASVVRTRMRLSRRVRVLTAQTQLSKRVLIALPILLFLLLNFLSPQYMSAFYTTTPGKYMLVAMVSTISFGAWVMNRLAVLKF